MIELFRCFVTLTIIVTGACIAPSEQGASDHRSGTRAGVPAQAHPTYLTAPAPRLAPDDGHDEPGDDVMEEDPLVTRTITIGDPTGWIAVDVVVFDGTGEDVSDWMDRTGYPEAATAPTVIAVTAEMGDVWGRSWSEIADMIRVGDRLLAPVSLAYHIDGVETSSPENIAAAAAAIALEHPTYQALDVLTDHVAYEITGPHAPGDEILVTLPAGDSVQGILADGVAIDWMD